MVKIRRIITPSFVDQLPLPEALKQEVKRVPVLHCELVQSMTEQSSNDVDDSQINSTNKENCVKNKKEVGKSLSMDLQSPKQLSDFSPNIKHKTKLLSMT